jgi:hypothetical protein
MAYAFLPMQNSIKTSKLVLMDFNKWVKFGWRDWSQ